MGKQSPAPSLLKVSEGRNNLFLGNVGIGVPPVDTGTPSGLTVAGNMSAYGALYVCEGIASNNYIFSNNYLGTWNGGPISGEYVSVQGVEIKSTNIPGNLFLKSNGDGTVSWAEVSNSNLIGDNLSITGDISGKNIYASRSIVSAGVDLLDVFGPGGSAGGIGGCGTTNVIAKFTSGCCIGDSIIRTSGCTAIIGGSLSATNNLNVGNNATILGNLSVQGDMHYIDTNVTVTSALSVINSGTGPALYVQQKGSEPIAHFVDANGDDIVFSDNGYVGLGIPIATLAGGGATPQERLTVSGNINIIWNI